MTRRAPLLGVLAGLVGVVALALGGAGWFLLRSDEPDCGIPTTKVEEHQPAFVDRAALVPAGSVGDERAPVVEAADRLPAPFGDVVAGRFYGSEERVPQLVADGSAAVLAVPPSTPGGTSTLQQVTLPQGQPDWTRTLPGNRASGGPVGGLFVTAVGGAEPTLVSVDAGTGDLVGCAPVPAASGVGDATVLTDQAGGDVALLATKPGAAATLSRVDPGDAEVTWDTELPVPVEEGSVSTGPGQVVVSRVAHDPVRLSELAQAGGIEQPTVTAYSLEDGSPTWTYPTEQVATTAAEVLEVDSRTGETYLLVVTGQRRAPANSEVVALDAEGRLLWGQSLGPGFWDGSLWGDLLVLQGPDPGGGAVLRALDRSDGSRRWSLLSRDFPSSRHVLQRFGPPAMLDGQAVVTAPGGLALIDPRTGEATPVPTALHVDQVLPVGDHVLLRAGAALLVLDLV